jgi:rare lipoprotein A
MTARTRTVVRPFVAALATALLTSACAGRNPKPVPAPPVTPPVTSPTPPPNTPAVPEPPTKPIPSEPVPPPPSPTPPSAGVSEQDGYATYMAAFFHGRTAANGERYDERKLVAAHRTLPFGSRVRVTNVSNGRSVTVRIVDRGPYGKNHREGTIIDLSRRAAERLRMIEDGQVPVRLDILTLADAN